MSFDVLVLGGMATYKLPEPWLVARLATLQAVAVAILVAGIAILRLRPERLRVLPLSGLLLWLYPYALPVLGVADVGESAAALGTILLSISIPFAPRRILHRLAGASDVARSMGVAAGLVAILIAAVLYWQEASLPPPQLGTSAVGPLRHAANSQPPDIYHVIFDGLGRPDVLGEDYGIDATRSLERLRELGFIADEGVGLANYAQTYLSLASMLNMTYLEGLPAAYPALSSRQPMHVAIQDAAVIRRLKDIGYRFDLIGSGGSSTGSHVRADTCHCDYPLVGLFESNVISRSPFHVIPWYGIQHRAHRRHVTASLDRLAAYVPHGAQPRLLLAHITLPHVPFVFDETGMPVVPQRTLSLTEGPFWPGTPDEYRIGYAAQARYAMTRVVDTAESLVDAARDHRRRAVIVLHGDHGPRRPLRGSESFDPAEAFPILLAIRWADGKPIDDSPRSLVNVYRTIFRGYFDADLPPLPDRAFSSSFVHPYQLKEVHGASDVRARSSTTANPE